MMAMITGTLSHDDDDEGSENVAKKYLIQSFNFYRVYLDPLNLSNVGDFSWSWILKDFIQLQKEKEKFVVVCSRSPKYVALRGGREKNVLKSVMHVQSICLLIKPIVFLDVVVVLVVAVKAPQ